MFDSEETALDIFGEELGRRCPATTPEEASLRDLHHRVAITYALVYTGLLGMPYCFEALDAAMTLADHPLSLIMDDEEPDIGTPWGLAKVYVDDIYDYLLKNDGWNADGSAGHDFNKVPFSDYSVTDSEGNSWTPYTPVNSPYEVSGYWGHVRR